MSDDRITQMIQYASNKNYIEFGRVYNDIMKDKSDTEKSRIEQEQLNFYFGDVNLDKDNKEETT